MRNFLYALLIFVTVLATLFIVVRWNSIIAWWNRPQEGSKCTFASEPAHIEGIILNGECVPKQSYCQLEFDAVQDAFAKSGEFCIQTAEDVICPTDPSFVGSTNPCVAKILKEKGWKSPTINNSNNSSSNNNSSAQLNLQVSNPNGAYMYYQSFNPASGGMNYGKSNLLIPYGKKFKLVNTFQTSLSGQPYAGFYETDFKQYGPTSGFFSTNDLMKI